MSADRYEIICYGKPEPAFSTSANGSIEIRFGKRSLYLFSGCSFLETHISGAIRQQARDLEQLRADLAAAVTERSEYWGALHSTKDELFECRANQRTLESDLRITRDQRDTYRARLAAIEVAPMVARVVEIKRDFASGPYRCLDYDSDKLPGGFVELIARPAKDSKSTFEETARSIGIRFNDIENHENQT